MATRRMRKRAYAAGRIDRLNRDWLAAESSADAEVYQYLRILRGRSRELFRNDDYMRRFTSLMKTNVIGADGVRLQAGMRQADGRPDHVANRELERGWRDFCRAKNASVSGEESLWDMANQVLDSWAVDGEILYQLVPGWDNAHGFAIKLIEADHLDLLKNTELADGNTVIMGVERNRHGQRQGYWLLTRHPGSHFAVGIPRHNELQRVDAAVIRHFFRPDRPGQTRGVPLAVTAMNRLRQLGAYEEAALIAARVGASKMGFYYSDNVTDFEPENEHDPELPTEAAPGTFELLPDGIRFQEWNPDHPNTNFADFEKAVLRGIASGLNVSYVGLSNNLEGVSYSSIRSGEMMDRDAWKMMQRLLVDKFYQEVFDAWLPLAITAKAVQLPMSRLAEIRRSVSWKPRGWKWVDPIKEVRAAEFAVKNGMESLYQIASDRGYDLEDILEENARAKELAESYGLKLPVFGGRESGDQESGIGNQESGDASGQQEYGEGKGRAAAACNADRPAAQSG